MKSSLPGLSGKRLINAEAWSVDRRCYPTHSWAHLEALDHGTYPDAAAAVFSEMIEKLFLRKVICRIWQFVLTTNLYNLLLFSYLIRLRQMYISAYILKCYCN